MTKYVRVFQNNKSSNKLARMYIAIGLLLLPLAKGQSEQLSFIKTELNREIHFQYQWRDMHGDVQSLSFKLDKSLVFNRYREFRQYKPKLAKQYINRSIIRHLRKEPIEKVQVTVNKHAADYQLQLRSRDNNAFEQAQIKLQQLETHFTKQYLRKNYYQLFTTPDQQTAIKPDHLRFSAESADDLKPLKSLILSSVSIKNIRKVTNYVLGFVQNIPYATLEDRQTSSGAGFNPPLKLLWENKGDCDSKVTLTAAMLRMLMPRIKIALIFIEGHALIGIGIPAINNEISINHNNTPYVLAEPTGPAILPLGKLAQTSEQAIFSGYYTIEELLD